MSPVSPIETLRIICRNTPWDTERRKRLIPSRYKWSTGIDLHKRESHAVERKQAPHSLEFPGPRIGSPAHHVKAPFKPEATPLPGASSTSAAAAVTEYQDWPQIPFKFLPVVLTFGL